MDLVVADPDGGPRLLIDVTVADPLRTAAESAVDRGHAAHVGEGLQRAKYADHSLNDTLIPHCNRDVRTSWSPFLGSSSDVCSPCRATSRVPKTSLLIVAEASQLLCYYWRAAHFNQSVCSAVRHGRFITNQLEPYTKHIGS
jgi:hypothetical protein